MCIKKLDISLWFNMRIRYSYQISSFNFNVEKWLDENKPNEIPKVSEDSYLHYAYQEYLEVVEEFKEFLKCTDSIISQKDKVATPLEIYDEIENYKIRIRKLLLILNLKLYKTYNVNKDTKVRYIVMRAFWIDNKGKQFRNFSKNLGAEHKILVNGKIPKHIIDSVEEYIIMLMWELYLIDYSDDCIFSIDQDGNTRLVDDSIFEIKKD